ncbi:MAG TPA: homocysteine S-methyltransferase family protein [Candidatus Krumholzibacteriaceae bacterium]|nr:homocysteine S-methyltransferase family protein [Candidatus Krumholzibacteriaceae bacterium]
MSLDLKKMLGEKVLVFDGAMGTMLMAAGMDSDEIPESRVFSREEDLIRIHSDYIDAGADVIQTDTFGASEIKLSSSRRGAGLDPDETNRRAALLAREARRRSGNKCVLVAGDIGPTGEFFPPVGKMKEDEARGSFARQARALDQGGVDLFLIETMTDLREAVEALRGVKEISDKPVVVELTFSRKPKGHFTLMGNTPREAVEILAEEGADMIGANCTLSSSMMIELAREMRSQTKMPLLFQPNAGQPVLKGRKTLYEQSPESFAADMEKIVSAGADAVGGCCGTTPEFIRLIRRKLYGTGA